MKLNILFVVATWTAIAAAESCSYKTDKYGVSLFHFHHPSPNLPPIV